MAGSRVPPAIRIAAPAVAAVREGAEAATLLLREGLQSTTYGGVGGGGPVAASTAAACY